MGGRGAASFSYKKQIKSISENIKTLNAEIKQRQAWGKQVYNDEFKKSNSKILAEAARKVEYRLNGYHKLIAERTKLEKTLQIISKIQKG